MTDQHDWDDEAELRRTLAEVPAPPPRLAVAGLLGQARRHARQRRLVAAGGTAGAVLLALVAVPSVGQVWPDRTTSPVATAPSAGATSTPAATPAAAAPIQCRVSILPPPDGLAEYGVVDPAGIRVTAMDPAGRYLVGDTYGGRNDSPVAVRWEDGEPVIIDAGGSHAAATDVNSRGDVVGIGVREPAGGPFYSWIYRDGTVTELALPAGYLESDVAGINESGDAVGNVVDADFRTRAVVWPAGSPGAPRLLPAPEEGADVSPAAITDDGSVVGYRHGSTAGYRWDPDGVGQELPLPAGITEGVIADARGDWAVGRGIPAGGSKSVPVRWDLRTGVATELPGFQARPRLGAGGESVNLAGDVVVGAPLPQVLRADGRELVLPAPGEGTAPDPVAVSDNGTRVAGNLVARDWTEVPDFSQTPAPDVPEPDPHLPRPAIWDC